MAHFPVLLKETIGILDPKSGDFFIDGTLGGGGHAIEVIKKIGNRGIFLGLDWDKEAVALANKMFIPERKASFPKMIFIQGNYADLPEIMRKNGLPRASGLLLDIGLSSNQLEGSGRGFGFRKNEPLDMRYEDKKERKSAADALERASESALVKIFQDFGEERHARRIAGAIVKSRKTAPLKTTEDLVKLVLKAIPSGKNGSGKRTRIHPATRIFQALRIFVNDELENLTKALDNLPKIMAPGGKVAIISFHSLEDRLVKYGFRNMAKEKRAAILTKKPIRPSPEEAAKNPRSRSAKLRAIIMP